MRRQSESQRFYGASRNLSNNQTNKRSRRMMALAAAVGGVGLLGYAQQAAAQTTLYFDPTSTVTAGSTWTWWNNGSPASIWNTQQNGGGATTTWVNGDAAYFSGTDSANTSAPTVFSLYTYAAVASSVTVASGTVTIGPAGNYGNYNLNTSVFNVFSGATLNYNGLNTTGLISMTGGGQLNIYGGGSTANLFQTAGTNELVANGGTTSVFALLQSDSSNYFVFAAVGSSGTLDLENASIIMQGLANGANGSNGGGVVTAINTPVALALESYSFQNFTYSGAIVPANGTATITLAKEGQGLQVFQGTVSLSSTTNYAGGLTFDYSHAGGSAMSTLGNVRMESGQIDLNGSSNGVTILDFATSASTAAAKLSIGNATYANAYGQNEIQITSGANNSTLAYIGTIARTNTANQGVIDISLINPVASGTAVAVISNADSAYGIVGAWATLNHGADWIYNPSNTNAGIVGASYQATNVDSSLGTSGTGGVSVGWASTSTGMGTNQLTSSSSGFNVTAAMANTNTFVNSLRYEAPGSIALGSSTNTLLTLNTGGILVAPASGTTISSLTGGSLVSGGSLREIIVQQWDVNGEMDINSQIGTSTANSQILNKAGPGTLVLGVANPFINDIAIMGGRLVVANGADGALGPANSTAWVQGGTLEFRGGTYNTLSTIAIGGNGPERDPVSYFGTDGLGTSGSIAPYGQIYCSQSTTFNGTISLGVVAPSGSGARWEFAQAIDVAAGQTFTVNTISVPNYGSFEKTGSGTLALAGTLNDAAQIQLCLDAGTFMIGTGTSIGGNGVLTNGYSIYINDGATLEVNNSNTAINNRLSMSSTSPLEMNAGTFKLDGSGTTTTIQNFPYTTYINAGQNTFDIENSGTQVAALFMPYFSPGTLSTASNLVTVLFRGANLGLNATNSTSGNTSAFLFTGLANQPNPSGASGTYGATLNPGGTNAQYTGGVLNYRIYPWAIGQQSSSGAGNTFTTYDYSNTAGVTNGVIPLATSGAGINYYTNTASSAITASSATGDNVLETTSDLWYGYKTINSLLISGATGSTITIGNTGSATNVLAIQAGALANVGSDNVVMTAGDSLNFGGTNAYFWVTGSGSLTVNQLTNNMPMVKGGPGLLIMGSTQSVLNSNVVVDLGTLQINAPAAAGSGVVGVYFGGTLAGSAAANNASVGPVYVRLGGTVAPGGTNGAAGALSVANLGIESGANLVFNVNGSASSEYSSITVRSGGAVNLFSNTNIVSAEGFLNANTPIYNGAELAINVTYNPDLTIGSIIDLIHNGGGSAVVNTFDHYAQGATITSTAGTNTTPDGRSVAYTFAVSYTGSPTSSSGSNDVVLQLQSAVPNTTYNSQWGLTGTGNWTNGASWTSSQVPYLLGDIANFGSNLTSPSTVTLTSPVTVLGANFNNSNSYTVAGSSANTLSVGGGTNAGFIDVVSGTHTISAPLVLSPAGVNVTFTNGAQALTIGTIANTTPATLSVSGGGTLISSAALAQTSLGSINLYGALGAPTLSLTAGAANTLSNLTVSSQASLTLGASSPLTLSNALNINTGGTLTLNGSGRLIVNGSNSTGTGALLVNSGSLAGGGSIPGSVTIASGLHFAPGSAAVSGNLGVLTMGGLTLGGGSYLDVTLGAGAGTGTAGTASYGNVTGQLDVATNGTPVQVEIYNAPSNSLTQGNFYPLLTFGSATLAGSNLSNYNVVNDTGSSLNFALALSGNEIVIDLNPAGVSSQWATNAGGVWSLSSNWSAGIPSALGDSATFGTNLGSSSTITLDSSRTISYLVFNNSTASYTIGGTNSLSVDGGGSAASINVQAGTHTINAPLSIGTNGAVLSFATNGTGLAIGTALNIPAGATLSGSGSGQLTINATSSTGTGTISMSGGAILAGGGTIPGSVNINSTAHLAPGSSATSGNLGTLSIGGTLAFTGGSYLDITLSTGNGLTSDGADSHASVGSLAFTANGTNPVTVNLFDAPGNTLTAGNIYPLVDFSSATAAGTTLANYVINNETGASLNFSTVINGSELEVQIRSLASTQWAATNGGAWSVNGNWTGGLPTILGDSATLGTNLASSDTVTLGANRTLSTLNFNNTNFSYTLGAAGGTNTITIDGGTSTGSINVANGSHSIVAPLNLGANGINVAFSNHAGLTLGDIGGAGNSISASGSGTMTLSSSTLPTGLNLTTPAPLVVNLNGGGSLGTVNNGGTFNINANASLNALTNTGTVVLNNATATVSQMANSTALALNNSTLNLTATTVATNTLGPASTLVVTGNSTISSSSTNGLNIYAVSGGSAGGTLTLIENNSSYNGEFNLAGAYSYQGTLTLTSSTGLGGSEMMMTGASGIIPYMTVNLGHGGNSVDIFSNMFNNTSSLTDLSGTFWGNGTNLIVGTLTLSGAYSQTFGYLWTVTQFNGSAGAYVGPYGTNGIFGSGLTGSTAYFNTSYTTNGSGFSFRDQTVLGGNWANGVVVDGGNSTGAASLLFASSGNQSFTGGLIIKNGGIVKLTGDASGANTGYGTFTGTGQTFIIGAAPAASPTASGTLDFSTPYLASYLPTSSYTWISGQTVAGYGQITGGTNTTIFASGSTLSPGGSNGVGALTIQGNLNVQSGATLAYTLNPSFQSTVSLIGTAGLTLGTNLTLSLSSNSTTGTYDIINYSSYSGPTGTGGTITSNFTFTGLAGRQSAIVTETGTGAGSIDVQIINTPYNSQWNNSVGDYWTNASNWTSSQVPGLLGDTANFGTNLSGYGAVIMNSSQTVSTLIFNNPGGYTIAGSGTLIVDGGGSAGSINVLNGNHNINTAFNLGTAGVNLYIANPSTSLSLNGAVSVPNALTVTGTGQLIMSGSSSGTGTIAINGGMLSGTGTINNTLTLGAGAHLAPGSASADTTNLGLLSFGGNVTLAGGSYLDITLGSGTVSSSANIAGTLDLNGASATNPVTVELYDYPGNTLVAGTTYQLLSFGTGTAAALNAANYATNDLTGSSGLAFVLSTTATALDLTISNGGPTVANSTWSASIGGAWGTSSNWSPNVVPTTAGDTATFASAIGANSTVTLQATHTVGTLNFNNPTYNYTLEASGSNVLALDSGTTSAAVVNVINGSHTVNAPIALTNYGVNFAFSNSSSLTVGGAMTTPTTNGAAIAVNGVGTLTIATTGSLPANSSLSIDNNATVALAINHGNSGLGLASLTTLSSLNIGTGTLDLGNNALMINYGTNTSPLPQIAAWVASGQNNPNADWSGTGITSSFAANTIVSAGNNVYVGVGYNEASTIASVAGATTFLGANIDTSSTAVLVVPTLYGDILLQGTVGLLDVSIFSANFNQSTSLGWAQGDFYDQGTVGLPDYSLFLDNFGYSLTGYPAVTPAQYAEGEAILNSLLDAHGTSVPEPASLSLLALGAGALLARRRRAAKA